MRPEELQRRIADWENLHTEFKRWPVPPDDLAAALVAFANTDGGQLIVGVSEERAIQGIADLDRAMQLVDNVAANNCEPPITVIQESVASTIVINIPKGEERPYRTNRGVYYVRATSGRRQASRQELLRLFQSVESLYYDETPLVRLTQSDLDMFAFEKHLEIAGVDAGIDRQRLLKNWGLMSGESPTIAGILLFGRDPQRHLPFAQINAARFRRDIAEDPSDRKDFKGQLLDVIDQAERFLYLHLPLAHKIVGFEPEPKPELPAAALREAIVNAVAHRDYTIHGPIRLFVFDDRIEVHTPGRPPNSVDEEAMRAGTHVVRNPRIYARLSDAGLVTRAGSGIRRMIHLVRQATGRDVEIVVRNFEVLVTIPRRHES
jgi:ATP-dependent DNA helicase RecG